MRVWWDKRLKWMRASTIAIATSLILLLVFAAFTIYGNQVGSFVINVDDHSNIRLSLSSHEDLSHQTERLAYDSVMELNDTTYEWLPNDISRQGIGNVSDMEGCRYLGYTFYLINNSDRAVDYDMELNLIDVVGDPLGMMRAMVIEEDKDTFDPSNRIFALPESTPERQQELEDDLATMKPYQTEDFPIGENKLFSINIKDFEVGGSRKYTVVIWLEGCDPDCVNENSGARAKMQLDITGY